MCSDSKAFGNSVSRRHFGLLAGGAIAGALPISNSLGNELFMLSEPVAAPNGFVEANNHFAFAMFRLLASKDSKGNLFFSPFSIESAVLMAMEGARSETAEEIGEAISLPASLKSRAPALPWNLESLRGDLKKVMSSLHKLDESESKSTREKVAQLRAQLAQLNTKANALNRKNSFAEAGKVSAQANQVANQINALASQVDQFQLNVANAIWADKTLAIRREFAQTLEASYRTGQAVSVDFKNNPEEQRTRINQWVADQTNQMILDLIAKGDIDSQTAMVLVNAIYFLGTWSSPFEPSQTTQAKFRNGKNTSLVSMMSNHYEGEGRYGAFKSDGTLFETPDEMPENAAADFGYPEAGYQVAELPYNGNSLSMLIIVPTDDDGIEKLSTLLTSAMLAEWTGAMLGRKFWLKLPKFKMECSNDLKAPMMDLGMKRAFDYRQADFTGMTDSSEGLFISKIVHKAVIDVNEKGTEAAAATAIMMAPRSAAPSRTIPFVPNVVADHPFLFLIRNPETGAILFMGQFTYEDR